MTQTRTEARPGEDTVQDSLYQREASRAGRSVCSEARGHEHRFLVSPKTCLLPSKLMVSSRARRNGSLPGGESECSYGTPGHVHGVLGGHRDFWRHVPQNFLFWASPEVP